MTSVDAHAEQLSAGPLDSEAGDAREWLREARVRFSAGNREAGFDALARVADTSGPFAVWAAAAGALVKYAAGQPPPARRTARVAIAGTYTTSQYAALLRLAALRRGIDVQLYEAGFGLLFQEILDPGSALYAFQPDYVILAAHEGCISFPSLTDDDAVESTLTAEVSRWEALWQAVKQNSSARVLQHAVAIRPDSVWGHLSAGLRGTRQHMLGDLNSALAAAAAPETLIIDCDRVAAGFGKARWFDDRYWHLAKQAVALEAVPHLARHTAAVLAGAEGLATKCVAVDLDNTLWGGVVGEVGLAGLQLGGTAQGEAHLELQEHLLALRRRGVLLAVVSKNNDADAREVFLRHPDMRLHLDDFAAFRANWGDKPSNLRSIAAELGIGLDAFAFVDDNPAERDAVRRLLPEVAVVALPADPSGFVRALSDSLLFETASVTQDDLARATQYAARAGAAVLAQTAGSLEEFYTELAMQAQSGPFDDQNLPRIAQLVAKTNQFNLTTRRHSLGQLRVFASDPAYITMQLRLRDRFGDHGLVAVMVVQLHEAVADIDSWLMSCRVIGRTVENEMLSRLGRILCERGITRLRGTFIPGEKNSLVSDLYARLGFALDGEQDGTTTWVYDIAAEGVGTSDYIGAWI